MSNYLTTYDYTVTTSSVLHSNNGFRIGIRPVVIKIYNSICIKISFYDVWLYM